MSLLLSLFELIEGKEHLYPLLDGDANPGPEHTQTSCCRKAACLPGSVGFSSVVPSAVLAWLPGRCSWSAKLQ